MIDEETYKKEIVRMWDTLRGNEDKGKGSCDGVYCGDCPLSTQDDFVNDTCTNNINAFKVIKIVEKWAKENPPKKYKLSALENDILFTALDFGTGDEKFSDYDLLMKLLKEGYYHGAKPSDKIADYIENCEVADDD